MSIKVMAHVWELDLPQREKFVLLALADHADDHGRDVFPSVAHLAWKTGYDRRSIQRIIRALEDRGVLEQVAPGGGRHTPARYAIHTAKGVSLPPFEPVDNPEPRASECRPNEVERAASTTERAANRTQKGGTGAARTVLNHQNQPPPARGRPDPPARATPGAGGHGHPALVTAACQHLAQRQLDTELDAGSTIRSTDRWLTAKTARLLDAHGDDLAQITADQDPADVEQLLAAWNADLHRRRQSLRESAAAAALARNLADVPDVTRHDVEDRLAAAWPHNDDAVIAGLDAYDHASPAGA